MRLRKVKSHDSSGVTTQVRTVGEEAATTSYISKRVLSRLAKQLVLDAYADFRLFFRSLTLNWGISGLPDLYILAPKTSRKSTFTLFIWMMLTESKWGQPSLYLVLLLPGVEGSRNTYLPSRGTSESNGYKKLFPQRDLLLNFCTPFHRDRRIITLPFSTKPGICVLELRAQIQTRHRNSRRLQNLYRSNTFPWRWSTFDMGTLQMQQMVPAPPRHLQCL